MTQEQNLEQISFQIILYAGNARSSAMEALQLAKRGKAAESKEKMDEAGDELHRAHQVQTELLQKEASGTKQSPNLLLIHAQDHLMNAITVKELVEELIEVYKKLT